MEGVVYTGAICKVGANWGFIKCDDPTMGDMFVIPQACNAFGRELPPMGTHVQFTVITDPKTGRPRADSVEPCASASGIANIAVEPSFVQAQGAQYAEFNPSPHVPAMAAFAQQAAPAAAGGGSCTGTMAAINGNFGFIKQDAEGPDMFVLPPFPPVGSRVSYDVIMDPKTGRPRAENVSTLDAAPIWGEAADQGAVASEATELRTALDSLLDGMQGFDAASIMQELSGAISSAQGMDASQQVMGAVSGKASGTMAAINRSGNFGFIRQDSGEADMFVLPPLFPVGTKLYYDVIQDPKTGRPRAENVQSADGTQASVPVSGGQAGGYGPCGKGGGKGGGKGDFRSQPYQQQQHAQAAQPVYQTSEQLTEAAGQVFTGTIAKVNEKFGFITQDSGDADMFVFPPACAAFGRELPPVGTRVQYHVVADNRTGRPRAEAVSPAPAAQEGAFEWS